MCDASPLLLTQLLDAVPLSCLMPPTLKPLKPHRLDCCHFVVNSRLWCACPLHQNKSGVKSAFRARCDPALSGTLKDLSCLPSSAQAHLSQCKLNISMQARIRSLSAHLECPGATVAMGKTCLVKVAFSRAVLWLSSGAAVPSYVHVIVSPWDFCKAFTL